MSYTPTEWKTGDVITADKLNNIEQGIVNAGTVIANLTTSDGRNYSCDKTYSELLEAMQNGKIVKFCQPMAADAYYYINADMVGLDYTLNKKCISGQGIMAEITDSNKYSISAVRAILYIDDTVSVVNTYITGTSGQ